MISFAMEIVLVSTIRTALILIHVDAVQFLLNKALFRFKNSKCKIFVNRLHGVLNIVGK